MLVKHITDNEFEKEVLKSDKPVLVDFSAEWCGPCKMAAPILEELSEEYKDNIIIVKVDVDKDKQYAGEYGVRSIPTVILFKDGKIIEQMTGFRGKEGYEEMIQKAVNE